MLHPIYSVLNGRPVNKTAAMVTWQTGCEDERGFLLRQELTHLLARIERKHRLLKRILGIRTKAQHTNLKYAYNKRRAQFRQKSNPRAFVEYLRCGDEIQRLQLELAVDRKCRQLAFNAGGQNA